ncbi:MAG: hypothetical protein KDA99_22780, partial [Planctomycetales bacterium]|nr:hypothetical protein [Planctomycetales bacterium]
MLSRSHVGTLGDGVVRHVHVFWICNCAVRSFLMHTAVVFPFGSVIADDMDGNGSLNPIDSTGLAQMQQV